MNATTGEMLPYNATLQSWLKLWAGPQPPWEALNTAAQCGSQHFGVELDPALGPLLSPPPPPPAPLLPPPGAPGETVNFTVFEVVNATNATNATGAADASSTISFAGKMGSFLDVSSSIMVEFGSIGLERPVAGAARRCADSDDVDGINYIYPTCGPELSTPPCEYVPETTLVGLRIMESFLKLAILPFAIMYGVKLLSILLLMLEDRYASALVNREARRLLREADLAEKSRASPADPDSPSRKEGFTSRMHDRMGKLGLSFGKSSVGKSRVDPPPSSSSSTSGSEYVAASTQSLEFAPAATQY